ncbi:MAG: DUF2157 domain-containing protein [Rhizobiaceae bacterium]
MASFAVGTRSQIRDWCTRGVIDESLARTLEADLDQQKASRSFSSVAIILGIICLCFGAITFVAANWEEMSRFTRLVIMVSSMAASYVIAARFNQINRSYFAQGFVLLGCACFGATVMLVGQMYHLPGHASGAILLWSLGTLVAAILTFSIPSLILAIMLATIWSCWFMVDSPGFDDVHFWYLPLWGICAAMAWYLKSRSAAHVCLLALNVWWLFTIFTSFSDGNFPLVAATSLVIVLFVVSFLLWSRDNRNLFHGFELPAILHLLLFGLVQLTIWYVAQFDRNWFDGYAVADIFLKHVFGPAFLVSLAGSVVFLRIGNGNSRLDHFVCCAFILGAAIVAVLTANDLPFALEAFALGLTIWIIRMGTRQDSRAIARLGYLGFVATMLLIYAEAAGGLLGTSLFYIMAGLLLVIGALIAPRVAGNAKKSAEVA